MNFLIKYCIFLFILLLFSSAHAVEKSSVVLNDDALSQQQNTTFTDTLDFIVNTAKYFDSQYPGEKINQDFHEDVAKHFPGITPQDAYDYQRYIRSGINIYRFAKNLFNKYIEAKLIPEEPPLVAKDNEYDLTSPQTPYIESSSDNPIIIQDFKKIISYGQNPREIKAYRAKLASKGEKKGKLKDFEEIAYILSQLDIKKLFFYNIFYGSPLTGNRGIGKWSIHEHAKVRLITVQTGINPNQVIEGAIHVILPENTFITAVDNADYFKPIINFDKSENLKNINFTLPLPNRLKNTDKDWSVYVGEFAIPFTAQAIDETKNLLLNADIKLNLCDQFYQCKPFTFTPQLELKTGYERDSSVATYIRMIFDFLKPSEQSELNILAFYTEKTADNKNMLTAVFKSPEEIESFSVFISNSNQITFNRPRISIENNSAIVRWLPISDEHDLKDVTFEITAEVNQKYILRQNKIPSDNKPEVTTPLPSFSLMLFLAFVCGFLMNFMPPLLPLWLLKYSSFSGFGFKKHSSAYHNLKYTFAGTTFVFLLCIIGVYFYSQSFSPFYWGEQLLSPWLIIWVAFLTLLLLAHCLDLTELSVFSPQKTQFLPSKFFFINGVLMIFAAMSISVPFLGDVIGYALNCPKWQALAIFTALFVGLTWIYLLIFYFPDLLLLIPAPGAWIAKLKNFTTVILIIAFLWLFFLIYSMSGIMFGLRFILYGLLFWMFLWLRKIALNLDYRDLEPEIRKIAAKRIGIFFAFCALAVACMAFADSLYSTSSHKQKILQNYQTHITENQIEHLVQSGETVLVAIENDWNPIALYNRWLVLNNPVLQNTIHDNNIKIITINWAVHTPQAAEFLHKFHKYNIPVYILFSPLIPDGLILPSILNAQQVKTLLENMTPPQVPDSIKTNLQ